MLLVLKFLSIDGLYKALLNEKEIPLILNLVIIILLVNYPIKPIDKIEGLKIKQLSLLSGKSNS